MKTLYVFGNEFLAEDSFAHEVSKHLHANIIPCSSPDTLLDVEGDITILDVVKDIHEPMLLRPNQIKTRNIVSLHDFDVGFFLNLMKELGNEQNIKIIGIPQEGNAEIIANKVKAWL